MTEAITKEYRPPAGTEVVRTEHQFSPDTAKTDKVKELMEGRELYANKALLVEVRGGIWVAQIAQPNTGVYYTEHTTYNGYGTREIKAVDYTLNPDGKVRIDRHHQTMTRPFRSRLFDKPIDSTLFPDPHKKLDLKNSFLSIFDLESQEPYGLEGEVTLEETETGVIPVLRFTEITPTPYLNTLGSLRLGERQFGREEELRRRLKITNKDNDPFNTENRSLFFRPKEL